MDFIRWSPCPACLAMALYHEQESLAWASSRRSRPKCLDVRLLITSKSFHGERVRSDCRACLLGLPSAAISRFFHRRYLASPRALVLCKVKIWSCASTLLFVKAFNSASRLNCCCYFYYFTQMDYSHFTNRKRYQKIMYNSNILQLK